MMNFLVNTAVAGQSPTSTACSWRRTGPSRSSATRTTRSDRSLGIAARLRRAAGRGEGAARGPLSDASPAESGRRRAARSYPDGATDGHRGRSLVEPNITDESFDTAIMDETMAKELLASRRRGSPQVLARLLAPPEEAAGGAGRHHRLLHLPLPRRVRSRGSRPMTTRLRTPRPGSRRRREPPVRRRPVRPRHPQPHHRRHAQHLPARRVRHADRGGHRHGHRPRVGLRRGHRRRGRDALTRRAALVPLAAARHGAAGERGAVQPQHRPRGRRPLHPDGRAGGAQHGARPQEQGVRRGGARARGEAQLHPVPRDPAQLAAAAARRGVDAVLLLDLPGRLARLPGPRRPAAVAGLGPADQRGAQLLPVAPWVLLFPACTIAVLVVSTSLMSDGLRQVMLPGGGRN